MGYPRKPLCVRFANDRKGNFTIMTVFLAVPVLALTGMAVDYYSVTNQQKNLQNATDSAVLAVATEGAAVSDAEAERLARRYLSSNFEGEVMKVALTRADGFVTLKTTSMAALNFQHFLGAKAKPIDAEASAGFAMADYEISLVLDTTSSMAGGKLIALKDAAGALVDDLSAVMDGPSSLKFALVPFSTFVNVGPQYAPKFDKDGNDIAPGAAWLDIYGRSKVPQSDLYKGVSRFALYEKMDIAWPGCVEERAPVGAIDYDVTDIPSDPTKPDTLFVPAFNPDEPDNMALYPNSYVPDGPAAIKQGTGPLRMVRYGAPNPLDPDAVEDDDDDDDDDDNKKKKVKKVKGWTGVPLDTTPQSFYSDTDASKGPTFGCDSAPIVPLTNNYSAVKKSINGLVAMGSTNIHQGVMWGWRSLSSRPPFSEGAKEGKAGNRKIMLLLTDGTNWFSNLPNKLGSRYTSFGYLTDERIGPETLDAAGTTAAMDEKTLQGCTNAKADGIEIFTVLLEEDNRSTSELLARCASSPEHFFDVRDRDDLRAVFKGIVKKSGKLRLAS